MALPVPLFDTFKASEVAFQAEDELVTVLARQHIAPIPLAGWTMPALKPMRQTRVPLWLALLLKKQGQCAIVFPTWLDEEHLREVLEQERAQTGRFASLPWQWIPVSHALLAVAPEDHTGNIDAVRQLLKDLQELREAKVRAGVAHVNESHIQMDGMSLMEINEVRPVIAKTMATLQRIRPQ